MKVSIVIPTYNAERYLPTTLDSVLAQTVIDWEMVIMDDGSQDGTRAIAEAYAAKDRRIRAVHQQNRGVAVARGQGFALTSPQTEAVIFLDNDDVWDPEALAALTEALSNNPDAVGAYVLACYIDDQGKPTRLGEMESWMRARNRFEGGQVVACQPQDLTTFACFAYGPCIPSPGGVLISRSALEAIGNFDQATAPCDDYDLYIRLARLGGMVMVDRVLFGYRLHGANVSDNKRKMHRSERVVHRKQIASGENTLEQKYLLVVGFRLREREAYRRRMREAWDSVRRREYVGAVRAFFYGHANLIRALRGHP